MKRLVFVFLVGLISIFAIGQVKALDRMSLGVGLGFGSYGMGFSPQMTLPLSKEFQLKIDGTSTQEKEYYAVDLIWRMYTQLYVGGGVNYVRRRVDLLQTIDKSNYFELMQFVLGYEFSGEPFTCFLEDNLVLGVSNQLSFGGRWYI